MLIKMNNIGFTEEKYRRAVEVLTQIGIVSSGVALLTSTAAYALKRRSTEWFIDRDGSWVDLISKTHRELVEACKLIEQ